MKILFDAKMTMANAIQMLIIFSKMQPKFASLIEVAIQEAMVQAKRKTIK